MNEALARKGGKTVGKWMIRALLVSLVLALAAPQVAQAQESSLKSVTRDALYGGVLGALLGTAVLAFVDKPSDHLDYIVTGAAVGILGGATWGIYESATYRRPAYLTLEGGVVRTAFPRPHVRLIRRLTGEPPEAVLTYRLLDVRF